MHASWQSMRILVYTVCILYCIMYSCEIRARPFACTQTFFFHCTILVLSLFRLLANINMYNINLYYNVGKVDKYYMGEKPLEGESCRCIVHLYNRKVGRIAKRFKSLLYDLSTYQTIIILFGGHTIATANTISPTPTHRAHIFIYATTKTYPLF